MSLKYGILGILNYTPMTGYKLKKIFDKSIKNIWVASLSQIYRELGALEKGGYVTSYIEEQDDRPDKRIYKITEDGKKAFKEWILECPDEFISPKRDEFMLRMFFGASMGASEVKKQLNLFIEDRKKALKSINENEKTISELSKAVYKEGINLTQEEERYLSFIIKRAKMTNKILIQWAEECVQELENQSISNVQTK